MGDHRLDAVPERFAQTDRQPFNRAFDDCAERVAFFFRCFKFCGPFGLVGAASKFDNVRRDWHFHHLLRNYPGGNYRQCKAAGEVAAAARIVRAVKLDGRDKVRVTRTRGRRKLRIILRTRVLIIENYRQRRSRSVSIEHPAQKPRLVCLLSGGRPSLSRSPPGNILREILFAEFDSRRHSVQHDPDNRSVGLPEHRHSEIMSKTVHYLIILAERLFTLRGLSTPGQGQGVGVRPRQVIAKR